MGIVQFVRLAGLLGRLSAGPDDCVPSADVEERLDCRFPGVRAPVDVYRPRRSPERTVIAAHGVTMLGNRDPRLIHFARSLARSRVTCLVPSLPGLSDCRWEREDVDVLEEVATSVHGETDGPVGFIGFCYGASYCLVAAARPSVAPHMSFVLAFGAFHSLGELFAEYPCEPPASDAPATDWDAHIYRRLVLAHQVGPSALGSRGQPEDVISMLQRYCHEAPDEEKRAFFDRYLADLDVARLQDSVADTATYAALSPAGQLDGLRCPVSLVHDTHDTIVPAAHSQRLYEDLQRLAEPRQDTLLVTELLSHVTLAGMLRLGDLRKLHAALAPVISS